MNRQRKNGKYQAGIWAMATILFLFLPFIMKAQRETRTLNDSWKFFKGECDAASDSSFIDSQWSRVHLPHTWNTDAYILKNYYRGSGWYRRMFTLPIWWKEKQIFLKMEAASKAATVFINGKFCGEHAGGYTACTFDLTPFLSADSNNVIAIRVDNTRTDIAPISGDFTFFGGIYRDIWLTAVPKQHFNQTNHGSDGIFISTPHVSETQATISIRSEIKNDANEKAALDLIHNIYQPDGTLLQTKKQSIQVNPNAVFVFNTETAPILHPRLWTPETPELYRIETIICNRKTKAILDKTEHYTGFRWFRFDADKGFFLNGKSYKLRGICRHQDQKNIGVALTNEMHRRDFHLMKEMGANFIRISHYPQDDSLLEMCDKMGMLAWEEIPIIDIVPDTPGYDDNCERNLREMIRQHYNHPSIIVWGYMNEILLVTQRRYKTKAGLNPVLERTLALAYRLEKVLKEEDATRISAMAFHGSNSYNEVGLSNITDVVGWNLYNGWYGGNLAGFDKFLEEQHRDHPTHPIIVSEYGAGSDQRLHSFNPRPFDFSIEYQQKYVEHYLPVLENTPYISGGTYWNFIDFSSASREESMPRINNKGLLYSNRNPKDVYYYYKAAWRKDIPVLHIATRDWIHRTGIQEESKSDLQDKSSERGTESKRTTVTQPVKVYSNLPEVELLIDGLPLGKKQVENYIAVFDVPFSHGEQVLQAQGIFSTASEHTLLSETKPTKAYDALKVNFHVIPTQLKEVFSASSHTNGYTSATKDLELAINVGSNCFFISDESHLTWIPDRPYTQGCWGYIGGKEQSTQTEIGNTADGPLFQTARQDIEAYRFDVPQGTYEVELLFTDITRQNDTAVYLLGKGDSGNNQNENSFSILANDNPIEESFTPCRENGYYNALRRKYIIHNDTNYLEIRFQALSGTCFLNGIKLRQIQ